MVGFRGPSAQSPRNTYAGVAGADLENAPTGPVPFSSPFGLPVGRPQIWRPVVSQQGTDGGVPGTGVQRASGNPANVTVQTYENKSPYGGGVDNVYPGNPPGQNNFSMGQAATIPGNSSYGEGQSSVQQAAGLPQFGRAGVRVLQQGQETAVRAPGNAPVGYSNDKLVTYDRHIMAKVGYENSGRLSGYTDPPLDGPARPSYMAVQRALNYQQGTDTTAATDDLTRDYTRNAEGMYVGSQGDGWSRVYGGTPGLYQEYGSYEGMSPSSPMIGEGIHAPVPEGQPGDGPHTVWAGPPHGLHSPTLPDYSQTLGRYMAIPQMARPRIDRPSNSPIAGQNYGQTVQSQGQSGFNQSQQTMSRTGFNRRAKSNGWRGRASG
jgi:hypothetical protein